MSNVPDQYELAKQRTELAAGRTRLAAERTYSAWIRLGLAGVGAGFAFIRLIAFDQPMHKLTATILGHFLIGWGVCIFIFALLGYLRMMRAVDIISPGKWSHWMVVFITVALCLFSVALMSFIWG